MAQITGFVLPFGPGVPQRLAIQLNGVNYRLYLRWNTFAICWVLDVSDADGNPIVGGIAVITGADLFEQYGYLDFKGSLFAYTTQGPPDQVPGFADLGITSRITYFPAAA